MRPKDPFSLSHSAKEWRLITLESALCSDGSSHNILSIESGSQAVAFKQVHRGIFRVA